jgi:glycosyltransferase involved in cell wall biosynthesis
MRIRHVLPQPTLGALPYDPLNAPMTGIVGVAWSLATTQAAAGHDVEIVAPGVDGSQSRRIAGVRVTWLRQRQQLHTTRFDFSYLVPLWLHTLRTPVVDVAHVHGNPYFLIRPKSRARVLHMHDSSIQPAPRMEQALARADEILCCSNFIRRELLERVTYPAAHVHVFPNGVAWKLYSEASRARARATLDIPDDRVVLVFAARMAPEKGLTVLLEALTKIVAAVNPAPLLLIAGTPKLGLEAVPAMWRPLEAYAQDVRRLAQELPVRFMGGLPHREMPQLYSAGDIFVSPSLWQEPFGMVNVEAQACGLPVVASTVGGIPDVVQHEANGLLVPPGDPQALADALLRLIFDRPLRMRLGETARQTSAQMDWQVLAAKLDAIYDLAFRSARGMQPVAVA